MRIFNTIALIASIVLLFSCNKDAEYPPNPFDKENFVDTNTAVPLDPNSIAGIHKNILSVSCALAMCHDGAFEPDYRTIESAYSTLVYHPVLKNSADSSFVYRVLPYNTAKSWLYHRITTSDEELLMPTGRTPLTAKEIGHIANWINNGCPTVTGFKPGFPNQPPTPFGMIAVLPDSSDKRVDTFRIKDLFSAFVVPFNSKVKIYAGFQDTDSTGKINYFAASSFFAHKLYYSTKFDKVESGTQINMVKTASPKLYPVFGGTVSNAPYYLHATINTAGFAPGEVIYFSVMVQEKQGSTAVHWPGNGSLPQYQAVMSMIIDNP